MEDGVLANSPQESIPGQGNPGAAPPTRCTLNGSAYLTELFALVVGTPAFMVTAEGSHEITRVYYVEDKFNLGFGPDRAGSNSASPRVKSADFEPEGKGLTLQMDTGHVLRIPASRLQSTWRV